MKGFREKKKRAKDPSRNLHKEKGAPVTLDEVTARGCPGHIECRQVGKIFSIERNRLEPCKRATAAMTSSAHWEIIVERDGRAWHPLDEETVEQADAE